MNKLHLKVGVFVFTTLVLGAAFLIYLLYARGFFEGTFQFQLAASTADNVAPGVPITFAGIEIGQVTTLGLNDSGGIIIRAELIPRYAKCAERGQHIYARQAHRGWCQNPRGLAAPGCASITQQFDDAITDVRCQQRNPIATRAC